MKNSTRLVPLLLVIGAASAAMTGCEIVADFDRTLIDAGQAPPADGSTDATATDGALKDGSSDATADSTLPDSSADGAVDASTPDGDAATSPDAADTSTPDTSTPDTSTPDAGQADAADGSVDAALD